MIFPTEGSGLSTLANRSYSQCRSNCAGPHVKKPPDLEYRLAKTVNKEGLRNLPQIHQLGPYL